MSHNKKHHLRGHRYVWKQLARARGAEALLDSLKPDAEDHASRMFAGMKRSELPPLAVQYCDYLCNRFAGCAEVCITAFAQYNQIVEGMPCKNDMYKPDRTAIEWFKDRGYTYTKPA